MVGHVLNEITKGLDRVAAYLDEVIVFDADRSLHVAIMKEFFLRLRKHNLKLSPSKATIGATDANFLGHAISPAGVMPNAQTVEALMKMSVPKNLKQVRSLLGDYSEYRKFLRDMAKRIWPIISLVKQGVKFVFTPAMETIVRELLAELSTPPVPVCPNWESVTDNSRPFILYCDASVDGFGASLEQEQDDRTVCPIVCISRATIESERHWTPLDLESGSTIWSIKSFRGYLWGTNFAFFRTATRSKASTRSSNTTCERSGG